MYYILYEGLKIESNEPVYCTVYIYIYILYIVLYILYISTFYCNIYYLIYVLHVNTSNVKIDENRRF